MYLREIVIFIFLLIIFFIKKEEKFRYIYKPTWLKDDRSRIHGYPFLWYYY